MNLRSLVAVSLLCALGTVEAYGPNPCVSNADGKVACPLAGGTCMVNGFGVIACSPAFGGIVQNLDGQFLCGPGQCLINSFGVAFCSSQMFGSATIQGLGDALCTG
jgi:hypothetical protein